MSEPATHVTRADPWQALCGLPVGPAGVPQAGARIDDSRVTDWLDVIGGPDPRPEAPLTMLAVWTMPGYRSTVSGQRWAGPGAELEGHRRAEGTTAVLAVDVVQTYSRPLAIGEWLSAHPVVQSVSGQKDTAVGPGRFVRFHETFRDGAGREVGSQTMTLLYHRPSAAGTQPGPVMPTAIDGEHRLTIDVSTSLVVAGALASRDFEPVHHDPSVADAAGASGVVMNTYTHLGFCGRLLAGADGDLVRTTSVALRMRAPALPGDRITYALGEPDRPGVRPIHAVSARGCHLSGQVRTAGTL